MDLKSRLSHLRSQAGAASGACARKTSVDELRARIARLEQKGRSASAGRPDTRATARMSDAALAQRLDGELIADGVIRVRARLPLTGRLGAIALQTLQPSPPGLPGEMPAAAGAQVYIDTETTGLSGGSGTLAFLVGTAVVGDQAIEVTQFLLTRFAAEAALLSAFAASLPDAARLVSYNGKSYDLPLLLTRFRMQGLPCPVAGLPHTDLLHPVRRLFGNRWGDCRLLSVEKELLGFRRTDDLPGSEAPAAWFNWIRHGESDALIRVVEHNRQDIVSLAVAHSTLAQAVAEPLAFGVDIHALARWLAPGDEDGARELLQAHVGQLCDDGKRLLARLLRRVGDWRRAVALWESLAAAGCADSMECLAKYHEHISRDLAAAQRCCDLLPRSVRQQIRRQRIDNKLAAPHRRRIQV